MKNDAVVKIHRVHHNSGIAMMAIGIAGITVLNAISLVRIVMEDAPEKLPFRLFVTLIILAIGSGYIWAALQTVVITPKEMQVKLFWFTLRTIPLSEIRTVVYLNYSNHVHNCVVLSLRSQEHLRSHGAAILHSDPNERKRWSAIGREVEEEPVKITAYFQKCFRMGWLKAEEGIWLATSMRNMKKIKNICHHANYVTTW